LATSSWVPTLGSDASFVPEARRAKIGGMTEMWVPAELRDRLVPAVVAWYAANARDLPWRRPGTTPWAVLVSEVMLQQTPVARVLPAYEAWLTRWPTPPALAADPPGEAVRLWGRLGYPRRALRLHETAVLTTRRYGGRLPDSYELLRSLPGVGDYTAAAVASFGYGRRHVVLDTNARRVLARAVSGKPLPPPHVTAAERRTAATLLPEDPATAVRWAVASMELGALVCRARAPACSACPVHAWCRWRLAGQPAGAGVKRRGQAYEGTDRQVRGRLLAVLREAYGPVPPMVLESAWPEPRQRIRALDGLIADGLVERLADGSCRLPGADNGVRPTSTPRTR
jgi:A/G-specific adenine glycosylase